MGLSIVMEITVVMEDCWLCTASRSMRDVSESVGIGRWRWKRGSVLDAIGDVLGGGVV